MDVGNPNKRMSKDMTAAPPVSSGLSRNGHVQATGGAGNYGPARTLNRPRAGSQASQAESRSRSSSVKESKPPLTIPAPPTTTHENQSSSTSRQAPPVVAPKPKLPIPPTQPSTVVRQTDTGSSSSSTLANPGETVPQSAVPVKTPVSAKPPLPPIPSSSNNNATQLPQHTGSKSGAPRASAGMDEFERTFPSLDDFGKRFQDEPELVNGHMEHKEEEEEATYSFPDVPSFPDLPSAPTAKPGLPSPPSGSPPARFESLKPLDKSADAHDSPPNPDVDRDTKRPSSQPNLTQLDGRIEPSSTDLHDIQNQSQNTPPQPSRAAISPLPLLTPSVMSPQSTRSQSNGHTPSPQPISFPTPQPTPAHRQSSQPQAQETKDGKIRSMKPKFPFSSSVNAETLRSYFLNPEVEIVLLDVRPEEENGKGYVGAEYESRGAKVRVVWMDPTVLLRNE